MVNPVHVNPASAARRLSIGGSDWLWVVTGIMGVSAVVMLAWAQIVRPYPSTFGLGTFILTRVPFESNDMEQERSTIWL